MKINNIFKIIGICSIIAPIPVTLFFLKPTYNLLLSNNAIYYDINYIFLIGKKEHPEIIGTYSFCGKNSYIISGIEDVENAIENLKNSKLNKVLIIVQTTYSTKVFDEIVEEIKEKISNNILMEVKNTICRATELRQEETKEISKKVDLMIIVGGKNSSNTNKLYDIAQKNCKNAVFVESKEELDKEKILRFDKIGIMAGASTPQKSVDEIIEILNK